MREYVTYIIPEYVDVNGVRYEVREIAYKAFRSEKVKMNDVQLPYTLKKICQQAFYGKPLKRIILPDGLEDIDDRAFYFGRRTEEIYIPVSVKSIGYSSFLACGKSISWSGYYKGYITCLPPFITEGNCTTYGIDEEAVRAYEKALER